MSVTRETLEKYLNNVFIETGSYKGDGILAAIHAGFKRVYSIELSPYLCANCIRRFNDQPDVVILHGNSINRLPDILDEIDEPVTLWLDAHWSGGETFKGETVSSVVGELDIISKHPIKTHTIMIDDVRDWARFEYGITIESAKAKILSINKDYEFTFEDGFIPNDIFVAHIPKQ